MEALKTTSSFKLNLIFNIAKMSIKDMSIYQSNRSDQGLSPIGKKYLIKGDLHIADLGYFVLKDFKNIDRKRHIS